MLEVLDEMPPALASLYHRMIQQIDQLERKDPEFCRYVLSTMILAYRPLLLVELGALSGLPERISKSPDHVARVIPQCGSFLTIRGGTVFFIHQSAKDYLSEETYDKFFPAGSEAYHYTIFSRSPKVLSQTLRRDVYNTRYPELFPFTLRNGAANTQVLPFLFVPVTCIVFKLFRSLTCYYI